MCPKGDDPLTLFTTYRTIVISTSFTYGDPLEGYFRFSFEGSSFKFPKDPRLWSSADCNTAFEGMVNIFKVLCTQTMSPAANLPLSFTGSASYTIQLKSFPADPYQNNIYFHNGDPHISRFKCTNAQEEAVFLSSWTGTLLKVIDLYSGALSIGQTISGDGIISGTKISAVITSYGTGTYELSTFPTSSSTGNFTLSSLVSFEASWNISENTLLVTSVSQGSIIIGQTLRGPKISGGTKIVGFISGTGGTGTYKITPLQYLSGASEILTGSSSSTVFGSCVTSSKTLTISSISSGIIGKGMSVVGPGSGIPSDTVISSVLTGAFGLGTYTLSSAQNKDEIAGKLASTVGSCDVSDLPLSSGYVYPGIL